MPNQWSLTNRSHSFGIFCYRRLSLLEIPPDGKLNHPFQPRAVNPSWKARAFCPKINSLNLILFWWESTQVQFLRLIYHPKLRFSPLEIISVSLQSGSQLTTIVFREIHSEPFHHTKVIHPIIWNYPPHIHQLRDNVHIKFPAMPNKQYINQ